MTQAAPAPPRVCLSCLWLHVASSVDGILCILRLRGIECAAWGLQQVPAAAGCGSNPHQGNIINSRLLSGTYAQVHEASSFDYGKSTVSLSCLADGFVNNV